MRAHGKEGFRETDSSNCFTRVVYESFRNEVKLNQFFEKTKVFFDLACMLTIKAIVATLKMA